MWTRVQLKTNAKAKFKRFYWMAVLAAFVIGILGGGIKFNFSISDLTEYYDIFKNGGISTFGASLYAGNASHVFNGAMGMLIGSLIAIISLIGIAIEILVTNVFTVGNCRLYMAGREHPVTFSEMVYGFKNNRYGNVVKTMFLKKLFTFLWSLLFVIPGIIKSYEYRMMPYLLSENPDMDTKRAFELSKEMMMGEKWRVFVLDLSFFWWYLLNGLTCRILGIFWLNPYIYATNAELYAAMRQKAFSTDERTINELPGYKIYKTAQ